MDLEAKLIFVIIEPTYSRQSILTQIIINENQHSTENEITNSRSYSIPITISGNKTGLCKSLLFYVLIIIPEEKILCEILSIFLPFKTIVKNCFSYTTELF